MLGHVIHERLGLVIAANCHGRMSSFDVVLKSVWSGRGFACLALLLFGYRPNSLK